MRPDVTELLDAVADFAEARQRARELELRVVAIARRLAPDPSLSDTDAIARASQELRGDLRAAAVAGRA